MKEVDEAERGRMDAVLKWYRDRDHAKTARDRPTIEAAHHRREERRMKRIRIKNRNKK